MAAAIPPNVKIPWPLTAAGIPSGWSRYSALDNRFVKQIASSVTAPGSTGGSATHDHPYPAHNAHVYNAHNHPGTWGDSPFWAGGPLNQSGQFTGGPTLYNHAHPSVSAIGTSMTTGTNSAGTTATEVSDPLHVTVIWISSDGTPSGWPVGGLAWFNGAAPTGWSAYSALDNRLMKGAAAGANGGAQAGLTTHGHVGPSHAHTISTGHTHVVSLAPTTSSESSAIPDSDGTRQTHVHALGTSSGPTVEPTGSAITEVSGNGDLDPPWQKMRAIQKTGSVGIINGAIGVWTDPLASIPVGWKLCDGTSSTPNLSQDKFVRAAAADGEVGNVGGTATHTHGATGPGHVHGSTGTHTHSFTGASGVHSGPPGLSTGGAIDAIPTQSHVHPSTTYTSPSGAGVGNSTSEATALTANSSNQPVFTGVAYIMFANAAPAAPTINNPANAQVYNTSVTLSATSTDPEADQYTTSWEYSPNNGTNWFAIPGTGSVANSGAASTLVWDVSLLGQGVAYTVRVKSTDWWGAISSTTTMSGNFTIDHNLAPNAPTLVAPVNAASLDMNAAQLFDWTFSDPNVGDTQSAYALKFRRVSDSLLRWWNGSGLATSETFISTAVDQVTVTGGTFTVAGEVWNWSVATRDSGGPSGIATGPYSGERTLTWSAKVNPVITDPTSGSPATIPSATYTMVWSVAQQTKYRARLLTGPGFTTVVQDSGIVTDSATRAFALGVMANGGVYRFEITTWNNVDLISDVVSIDKTVSYTPPSAPGFTLTARS